MDVKGILHQLAIALPEGDPERLFTEWLITNAEDLKGATKTLGVAMPPDGPNLHDRLRAAVSPKLTEAYKREHS